jgi:hypothetical protein
VKTERAVGWKPECHEIEPKPLKDRAMSEGDNEYVTRCIGYINHSTEHRVAKYYFRLIASFTTLNCL